MQDDPLILSADRECDVGWLAPTADSGSVNTIATDRRPLMAPKIWLKNVIKRLEPWGFYLGSIVYDIGRVKW